MNGLALLLSMFGYSDFVSMDVYGNVIMLYLAHW